MVGAGATTGSLDAANILKPALARGELHAIGATTLSEYKQHIDQIATLMDRIKDKDVTINFKATGVDQIERFAMASFGGTPLSGSSSISGMNYSSVGDWWDSIHASGGWTPVTEAFGGPVKPFSTLWVGERGPEVIRLGAQGGTVVPNNKLGGNSVSIEGIQITIQSAGSDYDADNLARQLVPALQKHLKRVA